MFKNILVVARGSEVNQPAIQRVLLCASPGARLVILDLVHEPVLDGYLGNTVIHEPLRARVVAERRAAVEELASTLTRRGFQAFGQAVWEYPLDEAVAKHARTESSDLVVFAPEMAAHGLTPTEWSLVTSCTAPVLVGGATTKKAYRKIVAAVDPFHLHAKPAELDREILSYARRLAEGHSAGLAVVHCYTSPEHFGGEFAGAARAEHARRLEALEALVAADGLPTSVARLIGGGAPHTLLRQMAERGEADLIVMGALARGRFEQWFIGSTAERVLNGSAADVLAVKPPPTS
jgi:nucleotide-binding universal stress UspA family protein